MTGKKFFLMTLIVSLVFIGAAAGGYWLASQSSPETLIEKTASTVLGAPVTIGGLTTDQTGKLVTLQNVRVANPTGFAPGAAVIIENINIEAESLSREVMVIRTITVSGLQLNLALADGAVNLARLKEASQVNAQRPDKSGSAIIARSIVAEGAFVNAQAQGSDPAASAPLSYIQISGLGTGNPGRPVEEAIAEVTAILISVALRSAYQAGFLSGLTPEQLSAAGVELFPAQRMIEKSIDAAGEALDKVADKAAEELDETKENLRAIGTGIGNFINDYNASKQVAPNAPSPNSPTKESLPAQSAD